MELNSRETDELLGLAEVGNDAAIGRLFERHRGRLRGVVASRLDRRVAARLDASDVLQEALGEASDRLAGFVRERPVTFYRWLRRLALQHVSLSHRFHLGTRKRSAARELRIDVRTPATTSVLVDLPASDTSPSGHAIRDEESERVRAAIDRLDSGDRAFVELRYVERLSLDEIGQRLGLGTSAVKMRHVRALKRFRSLIATDDTKESAP